MFHSDNSTQFVGDFLRYQVVNTPREYKDKITSPMVIFDTKDNMYYVPSPNNMMMLMNGKSISPL